MCASTPGAGAGRQRVFDRRGLGAPAERSAPSRSAPTAWARMACAYGLGGTRGWVLAMYVPTPTDPRPGTCLPLLLSVAEAITSCRELDELFQHLVGQLQGVVSFDFLGLVVYEPERGVAKTRVLETASMVLA